MSRTYKFRFIYDVLWFEVNTSSTVSNAGELHGVVEHDILSRQLQQHGIVEEFIDADVLAQTLNKTIREISVILLNKHPTSAHWL